ncbi:MAG: SDR family oxidoreductase [Anaerolineales bacterium]
MSENNIHVIFGTGPLGLSVMHALLKRGQRVKMVNRSGNVPAGAPDEVQIVPGDANNVEFSRSVCEGAQVVYQCAQPPYHEWPEKFPPLQTSIMQGAASAGARFIVGENLYMYGEVDGPIHEGLPYNAHTRKGKTRAEMAESVLSAHRSGNLQAAIGRGSDFYGPGVLDSTLGERAILPALQGKTASLVGKLDLPHTYTYIEDFGEVLVILGERQEALGQTWNVPNPPTLTQRELMTLFFDQIGKPPKMSGMGKLMMSIGGLFIPGARETAEMMYEFEKPFIVDSSKFVNAFGDIATPHERAVQKTVAWYCAHFSQQLKASACAEQISGEFSGIE